MCQIFSISLHPSLFSIFLCIFFQTIPESGLGEVLRAAFAFQDALGEEVLRMSTDEIISRARLLDNEVKIMKSEVMRISHELQAQADKIKENTEKIKVNKTLPYLVSNVIEVFM